MAYTKTHQRFAEPTSVAFATFGMAGMTVVLADEIVTDNGHNRFLIDKLEVASFSMRERGAADVSRV